MVHKNIITQIIHKKITTNIQIIKLTKKHTNNNKIYTNNKKKIY